MIAVAISPPPDAVIGIPGKPVRSRLVRGQIESREPHRATKNINADCYEKHPEGTATDLHAAELQSRMQYQHAGRDAERNEIRHGVEFRAERGRRLEESRREAIKYVE